MNNLCILLEKGEGFEEIINFFNFNDTFCIVTDDFNSSFKRALDYNFDYIASIPIGAYPQAGQVYAMSQLMYDNDFVIGNRFQAFSKHPNSLEYYTCRGVNASYNLVSKENHDWFSEFRIYRSEVIQSCVNCKNSVKILLHTTKLNCKAFQYPIDFYPTKPTLKYLLTLLRTKKLKIIESEIP